VNIFIFLDFFSKGAKSLASQMATTGGWQASLMDEYFFLWHCAMEHAQQCDCGKLFISLAFKDY
jgi:hypothetical protein